MNSNEIPSACPVCGAYSLTREDEASRLLAVCDVLTIKALEAVGKRILREERSRFSEWSGKLVYTAHTRWQILDHEVDKALRGAWDVVPALLDSHAGCCDVQSARVVEMLDSYVHDLVVTGTVHSITELLYRFQSRLGLPVYLKEPCHA